MLRSSNIQFCNLFIVLSRITLLFFVNMLHCMTNAATAPEESKDNAPVAPLVDLAYGLKTIALFSPLPPSGAPLCRPLRRGSGGRSRLGAKRLAVAFQGVLMAVKRRVSQSPSTFFQCRLPRWLRARVAGRVGRFLPAHALISNRAAGDARGSGA